MEIMIYIFLTSRDASNQRSAALLYWSHTVLSCKSGVDSNQRQTKINKLGSVTARSNSSIFFPLKQSVYDLKQFTRFSLKIKTINYFLE